MPLRNMPREQAWLLPPSLDELLPLDHPARFVAEFVDALDREDWWELGVEIEGDPLGAPSYHPRALLSVWLFGFVTGIRSSRKLEGACRDQIPYLWLTGWKHPDHNTLWRFYKDHRQAMRGLLKRTVRTALALVGITSLRAKTARRPRSRKNQELDQRVQLGHHSSSTPNGREPPDSHRSAGPHVCTGTFPTERPAFLSWQRIHGKICGKPRICQDDSARKQSPTC